MNIAITLFSTVHQTDSLFRLSNLFMYLSPLHFQIYVWISPLRGALLRSFSNRIFVVPSYLVIELAHVLVVCLRFVFLSCKNSAPEVDDGTLRHKSIYIHLRVLSK
jgi:hypothetical protein